MQRRLWGGLALILLVASFFALPNPVSAVPASTSPHVIGGNETAAQDFPDFAFVNESTFLATWTEQGASRLVQKLSVSEDRGGTWGPPQEVEGGLAPADLLRHAQIAVTSSGRVYLAYLYYPEGNSTSAEIALRSSDDGGETFSSPVNATSGSVPSPFFSLAANGSNVHVAWVNSSGGDWEIYTSTSTDGGNTFPASVRINDDTTARVQDRPSMAVCGEDLYVAWVDGRMGLSSHDLYLAASNDSGMSFSANRVVQVLSEEIDFDAPALACTPQGEVAVGWIQGAGAESLFRIRRSWDRGNTFSTLVNLWDVGEFLSAAGAELTFDSKRVLNAAWVGIKDTYQFTSYSAHVFLARSLSAEGFTESFSVGVFRAGDTQGQLRLRANPGGPLALAWSDTPLGVPTPQALFVSTQNLQVGGVVTGVLVSDLFPSDAVVDAKISFEQNGVEIASSNSSSEGDFAEYLAPGDYRVVITHPNHETHSVDVTLLAGTVVDLGSISLQGGFGIGEFPGFSLALLGVLLVAIVIIVVVVILATRKGSPAIPPYPVPGLGYPPPVYPAPVPPAGRFCPTCGQPAPPGWAFCPHCGARFP